MRGFTHFAAFVTLDLVVKAHAMYYEGRGFDSCATTFPKFFCQGICHAEVDLCCLSLSLNSGLEYCSFFLIMIFS